MWIPAQTTVPPFATAASAAGTSSPAGAKMRAASSSSGAGPSVPRPFGPQLAREGLRGLVTRAREGEHPPPLVARNLRDDVRARSEAVEPDAFGVAREPQGAVADQPRAEERAACRSS